MNIISRLTVRHLLENKKRTIVTILGIVASTALITAILVGIFSVFRFFGTINRQISGNIHADFDRASWEDIEALKEDERIELAGALNTDPKISGVRMLSDTDERFRVGNIMHGDNDLYKLLVLSDYDGELPEKADEVAVEEAFLKDNGMDLHVGDTITFEWGNRYEDEPDGTRIYYGGSYRSEEQFEVIDTLTCRITAILHSNRPTQDYDILRGLEYGTPAGCNDNGESYLHCRIAIKDPDHKAAVCIRQIAEDHNMHIAHLNSEFLISVFAIQGMGRGYTQLFIMMGIALMIVVATSVVLIYNAFGMSLAEKIKYLGMLASVGATRVQKRASIYFEGMVLGMIGIPLGILAGIAGAAVTLAVLGSKILDSEIIVGAKGMRGTIPVVVEPVVIVIIVILAAITIFISAFVPAMKASGIMPLDALRQTSTIRLKARKLRTNPWIRKIFGYEGELAYKNIKRNGIKGTVIVFSMAISIIMFLTIDFFDRTFIKLNQYEIDLPFTINVSCALDEKDRLEEELEALPEVDRVVSSDYVSYIFIKSQEDPSFVPANRSFLDPDCLTDDYKTLFDNLDSAMVILVDDADFNSLLEANGIDPSEYYREGLKGVILDSYLHTENAKSVFNEKVIGRKIFYDDPENNPPAVEIGGIVSYTADNYVCNLVPKNTVDVYVPVSKYYEEAVKHLDRESLSYTYGLFLTGEYDDLSDRISELTNYGGYHNCVVHDLSDAINAMDTVSLVLDTAMYGFTTLLTLIAIANIVNTISTAVHMRRQEFAMYKSVGMEERGIKKMLLLETVLYGLRSLAIGIPVSVLLSYLMFNMIETKIFAFELYYPTYLIIIVAVFAIVGLSMLLSARRINNDSIIEALKCDVI